jgi:hypothetical protein
LWWLAWLASLLDALGFFSLLSYSTVVRIKAIRRHIKSIFVIVDSLENEIAKMMQDVKK